MGCTGETRKETSMKVNNNNAVRQFVNNVTETVTGIGRKAVQFGRDMVRKAGNSRGFRTVTASVGVLVAGSVAAQAQSTPDASTIVTTASTTFNTVGALVASAVGFFIIVKIVKWIRK